MRLSAFLTSRNLFIAAFAVFAAAWGILAFRPAASPAGPPPAAAQGNISGVEEKKKWSDRIDQVGAEQAYREFKEAYAAHHFGTQHYVAHVMGALLYQKEGVDGFTVCDPTFAFGCYHSFFGQAIAGEGMEIISELDKGCVEKFSKGGTGCQHGLGHGLVEYMGHDKLVEALEACGQTTQENPLFGCTSGVFMEYNVPIIISEDTAYTKFRELDPERPHEPCPSLPDKFRKSCYYEMPQWWDKVYNHDYKKIGALCAAIPDSAQEEACYQGMGNVAAPSSEYDVAATIAKCDLITAPGGRLLCRSGASWSFFAEPRARERSADICEGLSEQDRQTCVKKSDLFGNGEKLRTSAP